MSLSSLTSCNRTLGNVLTGIAFLVALALGASPGYGQASSPFAALAGTWSGTGTITVSSGANEAIRCRARYTVREGGRILVQELRCASDSYKFEVVSNVEYQGGTISGTWSETSRNVSGNVSGRAGSGHIQARVEGNGFSASLAVTTSGHSQSVTIRPQGTDVTGVSISLRKG